LLAQKDAEIARLNGELERAHGEKLELEG